MPPKSEPGKQSGKGIFGFLKKKKDSTSSVDRISSSPQTPSSSAEPEFHKKALGIAGIVVDILGSISEVSSFLAPLKIVCDGLKFAIDTTNTIIDNDDTRDGLVEKLSEQQRFIEDHTAQLTDPRLQLSNSATNGLVGSLKDYALKIDTLSEKLDTLRHDKKSRAKGAVTRIFLATSDRDELSECTGSLEASFRRLMDSVIFFIADQTRFIAEQNVEIMARQALNQLKYVDGTQGNQHSRCLEGTRQEILKNITQWAADSTSKPMYCLADFAGTGKSTISAHMAHHWMQDRLLLAQFFFSRPRAITSGEGVPTTIAKDMAVYSPILRSLVVKALDSDPNLFGSSIEKKLDLMVFSPLKNWREECVRVTETVQKEMTEMIHMQDQVIEPWQIEMQNNLVIKKLWMEFNEMKKTLGDAAEDESKLEKMEHAYVAYLKALEHALTTPPVIVIDALDECADIDRIKILRCFLQFLNGFSSSETPFKLFVTCRPEEDVNSITKDPRYSQLIERPPFALQSKDTASNYEDIELYAKSRLGKKLDPARISSFVDEAGNLFIWASTAADFILGATVPKKRFDDLMNATVKNKELDTLYKTLLSAAIHRAGEDEEMLLRKVLQAICVAREPLTVEAMDELLDMPDNDGESVSEAFVKRLGSVLSDGSAGKPVQVLHATFTEYVLREGPTRAVAGSYENAEALLAEGCLAILLTKLKEDICCIRRPREFSPINAKVDNLQQRLQTSTTPSLRYAAVHGLSHVASSLHDVNVIERLRQLFKSKLPHWIELMSLLKEILSLMKSVHSLKTRVEETRDGRNSLMTEIRDWCEEIIKMVQPFQAAIEESASQVYISALPFLPSTSNISHYYHQYYESRVPKVLQGALSVRSQSSVLAGHTGSIQCFSFSPNGREIATGSGDNTVRQWDVATGAEIGTPLVGHTRPIWCLSFSPDGREIATGSDDNTVRLWDATTCTAIGPPLMGHTGSIQCLSFSPDGRQIATGSLDKTARLWDAASGVLIGKPLVGHAGSIMCLSFSPSGRQIATGSLDFTLQIWNAATGVAIGIPLAGHTGPIRCLSFSRDGRQIATGSDDNTVRLWDATTCTAIGPPLMGHTGSVQCLSFSPDGQQIATGSLDKTAWLWDAATGIAIGPPLAGHTDSVWCLSFSHDGRQIATGSLDKTVRLWDLSTGTAIGAPLTGHTDSILCLSFSFDGQQIATGSLDKTARLWDISTSTAIGASLAGHADTISCLSFSLNGRQIATGSSDNTVRLWDAATGVATGPPLVGHTDTIWCLSFSPDGRQIATGSVDKTVRRWDAATSISIGVPLVGHADTVLCLSFSPSGQQIATGSGDWTLRLWDAATGSALGTPFVGHTDTVRCLHFSPNGRQIATGSGDNTVRLWDAATGATINDPIQCQDYPWSVNLYDRDSALLLAVNGREIYNISSDHPTRHSVINQPAPSKPSDNGSLVKYDFRDGWTYINSQAPLRFRLPSSFVCRRYCTHKEKIAYGGENGSLVIIDCTHLL